MDQTVTADPLAKTIGLVPRYVRERQAAEALERSRPPAPPPAPALPREPYFAARPNKPAATGPRPRIAIDKPPRRVKLMVAAPAVAGILLMLGALLNH